MRNTSLEQKTIDQVTAGSPEAKAMLRRYRIDPTNRMTLATAAAATSTVPDALLAEMEYRMRRMSRRQRLEQMERELENEWLVGV
jgi:hypothetical protein